jgi:hypothetical protein
MSDSNGITYGGLQIHTAWREPGEPICIGDKSGQSTIYQTFAGRNIEIYTYEGHITGVRVSYFDHDKIIIEAEVGEVPELDPNMEEDVERL